MVAHLILSAALALTGPAVAPANPSATPSEPTLRHCLVSLIEEVQLPGREPGVLVSLEAREGMQVTAGEVIGQIDDSEPAMAKKIKTLEFDSSRQQSESDVDVRYAAAAAEVAKFAYLKAVEANTKSSQTVPAVELSRLKLDHRRAELQIEKAYLDRKVAKLTADVKYGEVEAADLSMQRRQIKSPLDGVVVHVYHLPGEWVPAGDPVLRIVRVDRLRVKGRLNTADYGPEEIAGKLVTVDVDLARGRKLKFPGKVTFISPLVQAGGEYEVWAEVANRLENGQWILRPGLNVNMTIHLK